MASHSSRFTVVLGVAFVSLTGLLPLACGGHRDPAAERDSKTIQENVKQITEENSIPSPKPDPDMEKLCGKVSEKEMEQVEAKVKAGEVLVGADMNVLRCSRYHKWLRGEVSSY